MVIYGTFLVKKRPFKWHLNKIGKTQQLKSQKQGQRWISCLKEPTCYQKCQLVKSAQKNKKNATV